ncbi:MAG: MFS transporter [Ectothiorhodospiraceae bacterium]|nr:MFS transporter [Chromatiales bacterium]MCP5155036.1 MFS transporter [Ectothiorhodospiraceae bacterium]
MTTTRNRPTAGTGWRSPLVVLACGGLVLLLSFGIRTSFGIFLAPMSAEMGWGRESFALAMAVQSLLWGLVQPLAGAVADRYGAGRVVALAGFAYLVGLYLMAGATSPLGLGISAGLLLGLALAGSGFPVVLAVIGRSVPAQRRSLFLGIASAAGSSGQLLVVPYAQVLLDQVGWFEALTTLSLMAGLIVPLAAALAGRPASDPAEDPQTSGGLGGAIRSARAHSGFWLLTAGFFVCGFHVTFIGTHLPAYVADQGIDPALGATALALIGLGNIAGSLACGILGGWFPKKYVLSALYLARSVVMSAFLLVPVTPTTVLGFALAIGLLWLGTVPLTSALVAQIFGPRYMATLFGLVFLSHQIGSFLGAWAGGAVFDATGSYDSVWWTAVGLGVVAAALHWPIRDAPLVREVTAPGS